MKLKDLAFVINKLNEEGFGEVELYTHWEDFKDKYPKEPEFHLCLNGMNGDDFTSIFAQNPFTVHTEIHTFGICKEMSFIEKFVILNNSFDIWHLCNENRKYMGLPDITELYSDKEKEE